MNEIETGWKKREKKRGEKCHINQTWHLSAPCFAVQARGEVVPCQSAVTCEDQCVAAEFGLGTV